MIVLFSIGSVMFWIITVCVVIGLISSINYDNISGIVICSFFYFLYLQLVGVKLIALILSNPLWSTILIGSYLIVGGIWSIIRWWIRVKEADKNYNNAVMSFLTKEDLLENYYNTPASEWPSVLYSKFIFDTDDYILRPAIAKKEKERISTWIIMWPLSLLWTFTNNIIKNISYYMIDILKNFYTKIEQNQIKR